MSTKKRLTWKKGDIKVIPKENKEKYPTKEIVDAIDASKT